jgi:hypothetical protein
LILFFVFLLEDEMFFHACRGFLEPGKLKIIFSATEKVKLK